MISNIEQFFLIMNKKNLLVLNLLGNPVEKDERCKVEYFLRIFPNLREFNDRSVNQASLNGLKTMKFTEIPKLNLPRAPMITDLSGNIPTSYNNTLDKRMTMKPIQQIPISRSKSSMRSRSRSNLTHDMPYMLKDIDQYGDASLFENQRTATFAQMQKYNSIADPYQNHFDDDTPVSTDRFHYPTSQNFHPYQGEQSIMRGTHGGFNGRSVDVSLVRYSPNRSSVRSTKPASGHKRTPFAQLSNVLDVRGKLNFDEPEQTIIGSSLFDKHINNIEKDIEQLAIIFHQKALKEKSMKAIRAIIAERAQLNFKADQFFANWKTIQVFYAWLFYFNTSKRKTALIRTINESKAEQYDYPMTYRNPPVNNKKKTFIHYSDGKHKDQYGYYYA